MKPRTILLVSLVLIGPSVSGCKDSTGVERCTRPDVNNACSSDGSVNRTGNPWTVVANTTTTRVEAYDDGGFVCNLTVRSCSQKICFVSVGDPRSDVQMIASCRG